jgi:hypothetical protein
MTTAVNRIKFIILNQRQAGNVEDNPEGAIKSAQIHIPNNQLMEMSADDFLWTILIIKGIFHKGITTDATVPIVSIVFVSIYFFPSG